MYTKIDINQQQMTYIAKLTLFLSWSFLYDPFIQES